MYIKKIRIEATNKAAGRDKAVFRTIRIKIYAMTVTGSPVTLTSTVDIGIFFSIVKALSWS